jgi:hypothetical protein
VRFGPRFGFYGGYGYGYGCWRWRLVATPWGWAYRRVNVCYWPGYYRSYW